MIAPDLLPLARPIASLREDPGNARTHDKRNVDAIAKSLTEFGQRKPVIALRDGTVIAGNGTLRAATSLGWTEIAVATFEDEERAKAYALADNRTAELAAWDDELLVAALRDVPDELRAAIGFNAAELERLLGPTEGLCDGDEIPPVPAEPTTRPGDLYILGERRHRLLCGNSTNAADVARLLDGAKPELMVTDPPYGISLDMQWRDRAGLNSLGAAEPSYMQRSEGHTNTTISGDTKYDWSDAFALVPSLRVLYVWHASSFTVDVGAGLRRIGFDLRQMCLWRKPHAIPSRTHYWYQSEPCWLAVRHGETAKWIGSRDQSNVWDAPSPKQLMGGSTEEKFDHPTQKPLLCMEKPIANHDFAEVFEPFAGSGTTVIACERQRRRCFAMEVDPRFCDLVVARFERYTGQKATRVSS